MAWNAGWGDGYHWTSSAVAKPIVRRAREIMEAADLTATAALHQERGARSACIGCFNSR